MRFIRLFLTFLIVGIVAVSLVILVIYEGRLWYASYKLQTDFIETKGLAGKDVGHFRQDCYTPQTLVFASDQHTPTDKPPSTVLGFSLRFTDDTKYQIEVVCKQADKGPFTVKQAQLLWGIKKMSGTGVLYPIDTTGHDPISGLVLVGDRYAAREVGLWAAKPVMNLVAVAGWQRMGADAAATVCQGWGYQCCNPVTQVGQGTNETRVLDCQGQCYPACLNRPMVAYFNSDPVFDPNTRTVRLTEAVTVVSFGFEIAALDNTLTSISLDFGDGQTYLAKNNREIVQHTYTCHQTNCVYKARLTAQDSAGLTVNQPRLQDVTVIQSGK